VLTFLNNNNNIGESMKITCLLQLLVLSIIFSFSAGASAEDLGALRLGQMDGDVQIQSVGMDEWLPATVNLPLRAADRLWVPQGASAQIEGREGSVIRLDGESSLEIVSVEKDALQLYLSSGQAYLNFQKRGDFMLQIDTPVSSFRTYDDAILNVVLDRSGNVDLSVFRGEVLAENSNGEVRVKAGRTYTVDEGTPFLTEIDSLSDWERWNREQDEALAESDDDSEYLPPELSVYGRDLNRNGRWVSTREYGYVWTPTMHVSVDWAPYRHGRWVWIGNDYVWIGNEPWGWAPYHYGRWSHVSSYGWCWVPPRRNEVYWGPGYVSWIQTTSDVAWVPLAPYEVYYGHGNYGPFSVNIIDIDIYTVVPGRHYRNARVRDAVTVVHRDAFLSGRYRDGRHRDNPFLHEKIHFGRPRLEPQRLTRMPAIKEIPHDKRPPAHFRSMSGRGKEGGARPMVKDRDRSVFKPVTGPQHLSLPVSGVRSETVRHKGDDPNRSGSFRDRQHFPERGTQPESSDDRPQINRGETRERRLDAPMTGVSGAPAEASSELPVREERVRTDDRDSPSMFRGRQPSSDQDERSRSFRERPTVNREQQERSGQPDQVQPRISPPVESPSPSVPVREPRMRSENSDSPSMFRGRQPSSDQDERSRSFRERPTVNHQQQERASQPSPPQPQVASPPPAPTRPQAAPPDREEGKRRHSRTEEKKEGEQQDENRPTEGGMPQRRMR
jgi:hypothetical protein